MNSDEVECAGCYGTFKKYECRRGWTNSWCCSMECDEQNINDVLGRPGDPHTVSGSMRKELYERWET